MNHALHESSGLVSEFNGGWKTQIQGPEGNRPSTLESTARQKRLTNAPYEWLIYCKWICVSLRAVIHE